MTFEVIPKHYNELKECIGQPSGWPPGTPRAWYQWVVDHSDRNLGPNSLPYTADRAVLREMVTSSDFDTLSCCMSILAWGGMNRKHGVLLCSCGNDWLKLADEIRGGKYSRQEAYHSFAMLRHGDKLKGMGPAYFTKLIFFLMPSTMPRGYIMDQWTSASVNLLSGARMVEMNRSFFQLKRSKRVFETVSDKNTSRNYESYCDYVEILSNMLTIDTKNTVDPDKVEEMLFSKGRGQGKWRSYLVSHR